MESTTSTTALQEFVTLPSLTKEVQSNIAQDLIAQVKDGYVDPIEAFVKIKAIAEICAQFLSDPSIVESTTGAVDRYGKENAIYGGAKVSVANTTRYDYSFCGDKEYDALVAEQKAISDKVKAREMFLKAITTPVDVVDRTTGEVSTVSAPVKKCSTSLRVLFAK